MVEQREFNRLSETCVALHFTVTTWTIEDDDRFVGIGGEGSDDDEQAAPPQEEVQSDAGTDSTWSADNAGTEIGNIHTAGNGGGSLDGEDGGWESDESAGCIPPATDV